VRGRGTCALPDDEPWLGPRPELGGAARIEEGPQQREAGPAKFDPIEPDRGERGSKELRLRGVVEADHADRFRDPPAGLVQGPDHADREVVVAAQDRGDLRVGCESATGLVTRTGMPSRLHGFGDGHARLLQGHPPARRPLGDVVRRWRYGDVVHGLVAQAEQETGGVTGGLPVIYPGPGLPLSLIADGGLHGRHHRHASGDRGQGPGARPVEGEHDEGATWFHRTVHGVRDDVFVIGLHDPDADREPGRAGRLLDPPQDGRLAVQRRVGGQDRDGLDRPARQRAGRPVRPEAEILDGGQDEFPGRVLHPRMLVYHPGDRLIGNSGRGGDVADAHRPHGTVCAASCVTGHIHARIVTGHTNAVKAVVTELSPA
jgi:hypothetical protein